jgi:superfamily II DNA helicase RecQ
MKSFDQSVAYSEARKTTLKANLERVRPSPQILLLTATANKAVSEEICKIFKIDKHFQPEKIFQKNFKLNFKKVFNPNAALLDVMKSEFKSKFPVIIFCSFKKSTETITTYLQQNGYKSFCFHGGLSELQKMNTLKELDKLGKDCDGSEGILCFFVNC